MKNLETGIGVCVHEKRRMSVVLTQVSKARLSENSRNSKPGVARASRSGEGISPKQEIVKCSGCARGSRSGE